MPDDDRTERRSPVGDPVVRGDPAVTGDRATDAVEFDPDDPADVDVAADVVAAFAAGRIGADEVEMLRGAAACAALVRAVGSYRDAVAAAGDETTVAFVRKWARVHDLPQSVRRHVARGTIAPSAAKHVARISGTDRLDLAWAVVDHGLTVREVRDLASTVADGVSAPEALRERGYDPGRIELSLPVELHRKLRRRAATADTDPSDAVAAALAERFD